MDPEVALGNCRHLARRLIDLQDGSESGPLVVARMAQLGVELAEQFQALDEWRMRGGFLPLDWKGDS